MKLSLPLAFSASLAGGFLQVFFKHESFAADSAKFQSVFSYLGVLREVLFHVEFGNCGLKSLLSPNQLSTSLISSKQF